MRHVLYLASQDEAEMGRPKRWYDPEASASVRVIARDDPNEPYCSIRWLHPRVDPTLWECLRYPLTDGPGLGLLFFFPPMLWALSLPIFDIIAVLQPMTKGDWRLGLMVVPVMIPVVFSFLMIFGYAIVFLGHVLVASSLGENDHPTWPEWHPADIAEGFLRWIWAMVVGLLVGAGPIVIYWFNCGQLDAFDCLVFSFMIMLAAGFGQMALAAALLHVNIIAANPITVVAGIIRIGWAYLWPCLLAGIVAGVHRAGSGWPPVQDAADVDGGPRPLGILGARPLSGYGVDPDDGADLPRARPGPGVVPSQAAVGDFAASWEDLRQLITVANIERSLDRLAPARDG